MTNTILWGDKSITYSESFWTGKKKISINGQELQKLDKKTYRYGETCYTVNGSYLTGVELSDGEKSVMLVRKLKTFEMILCFLPFLVILSGGATGGICGGIAAAFNAVNIRKTDNVLLKILCAVLSTVVAFICYIIIASLFLILISG